MILWIMLLHIIFILSYTTNGDDILDENIPPTTLPEKKKMMRKNLEKKNQTKNPTTTKPSTTKPSTTDSYIIDVFITDQAAADPLTTDPVATDSFETDPDETVLFATDLSATKSATKDPNTTELFKANDDGIIKPIPPQTHPQKQVEDKILCNVNDDVIVKINPTINTPIKRKSAHINKIKFQQNNKKSIHKKQQKLQAMSHRLQGKGSGTTSWKATPQSHRLFNPLNDIHKVKPPKSQSKQPKDTFLLKIGGDEIMTAKPLQFQQQQQIKDKMLLKIASPGGDSIIPEATPQLYPSTSADGDSIAHIGGGKLKQASTQSLRTYQGIDGGKLKRASTQSLRTCKEISYLASTGGDGIIHNAQPHSHSLARTSGKDNMRKELQICEDILNIYCLVLIIIFILFFLFIYFNLNSLNILFRIIT